MLTKAKTQTLRHCGTVAATGSSSLDGIQAEGSEINICQLAFRAACV